MSGNADVEDVSPFKTKDERAQERERKREAVLLAAVRLFNARGFHAASLDDLATKLGVGKPTIYHYLGNKEQVLFECVTRGLEGLREIARRAHGEPGSGLDRLRAALQLYGEEILADYGLCVVRTGDELLSPESAREFRQRKRQVNSAIQELVEQGMADGSIEPGDAQTVTFTLAGAINWMVRWFDPQGPKSAADAVHNVVDVLLKGIEKRPSDHDATEHTNTPR